MDIDISKENIQPLRGGRNLTQLGTALQAQSDTDAQRQLQLQKEEHEAAIRQYEGPDPLDPWFNYIQWVEQCYPKHGHEGHMDKLIKDCLQQFEKDERYYQDRRLVKLWIKYIDCLSNPLEIYQRLYNSGIGVQCSEFYRAWACYCEESGDYKKANQVYMLGMQAQAQPIDELEQAHMNFQLFFAQRMLHDDSPTKRKAASALAETRMALTSLKSFKRRNIAAAPVQRVGDSVRSLVPGTVRQGPVDRPASNVMVTVYEDGPASSTASLPAAAEPGPASLVAVTNRENEKEVGVWTLPKTKMVHANLVPHQPPPFIPYEDSDDVLRLSSKHLPACVDDLTFTVPLCVPDPPDPTKIPHYNKAEVYVGDKEYSLEEIRSRKYILNKTKTESPKTVAHSSHNYSQNINETLAQCSALETLANCALDPGQDHLQMMNLSIPALQNITKVTNMHSPGEPKVLQNLDSKEFSDIAAKKIDENQRPKEADKENAASNMNNSFGNENCPPTYKNNLMEEFNRSLLGNLMSDSVTVNTKEARWELRNIFNDNEPSMVQPVPVPQFEAQPFAIHEDRSITMALCRRGASEQGSEVPIPPTASPADKENAVGATRVVSQQQANKTAYYEEPSCTQVFNFNIKDASTPNACHFKRPLDQSKYPSVPKFSIDDSGLQQPDPPAAAGVGAGVSTAAVVGTPQPEPHPAGLSVIMEATREYNSKSGSTSSSGQSTRTNFTGYTTNYDSMYNHEQLPTSSKRSSLSQPRLANGQFARASQQPIKQPDKQQPPAFLAHDHQYQKPAYNGYSSPQRMHNQYQQNYSYQQYGHPQMNAGYASPQAYNPPSPHVPPAGFHSPPYAPVGYPSPTHAMSPQPQAYRPELSPQPQAYRPELSPQPQAYRPELSPQQQYRPEFHYSQERQHVYANQQFQSPPHQPQYTNQYYQRTNQYNQQNQTYQLQQQNYSNANVYASPQTHNQSQSHQSQSHQSQSHQSQSHQNQSHQSYAQSPYRQVPKVDNVAACQNQPFQVYQSPQNSFRSQNVEEAKHATPKAKPEPTENLNKSVQKSQVPHKSPTAALRNIRHEQPKQSPDVGFSNQFINFISNRNEPKDTANTPKFTNSPNISQKMHKNLYVSSPEQAQIPPSSGMSDSDSKDGMTAQTLTPIQSANVTQVIDKQKDISKRQLDFEQRAELQSEDSRDSVSKESRISSVYSRQSDFQSDGYGMDVDSENSMECGLFKSTHSISLIETSDIPRPADIDFPKQIDPFNKKLLASLLQYVQFPNKTHAEGYVEVRSVPKIQLASVVGIGNNRFSIEKQLGKGNYGAVFLCLDLHSNKSVAVKYQKPSRPWEFYICQEIKARIKDPFMLPGYMDITTAFIGENASLFVSEYSKYGSLLDVANKVRMATSKCINESIVILLASEMLSIVHYLHKAQIIHADIKPDNFLLMQIPAQEWRTPSLQLIDLGCAIDMSLFPPSTTFRELIATEGFTCTEMRSGKPWTYQTDLYCLAGTIHVVLMGCYMKVTSRHGHWAIDKKLPRYMKASLWDKIFTTLLNVPDCTNLPDLLELKNEVDSVLSQLDNLGSQLRSFDNVLKSR